MDGRAEFTSPELVFDEPLVGRKAEQRAAWAVMERAHDGWGQVLGLTGEPGIGKSRLAAEIGRLARRLGFDVHRGACREYGTTTTYLVWHPIWRALFELDPALAVADQQARLTIRLAERAPLLGPAVNLPMPDSEATASLDPQTRIQELGPLLLDHLRASAAAAPLLLILEDCHWIDPASQALLDLLAPNVVDLPVLIVVTSRSADATTRAFARLAHFTEIRLAALRAADAERLVEERIRARRGAARPLPPHLVAQIAAWGGGNPFHLEELVRFLLKGEAGPSEPGTLVDLGLLDDPRRLVLARTDRLGRAERATIEIASVLGSRFPADWIWGSDPTVGTPEQVLRHLEHLTAVQFLRQAAPARQPEYAFRHAITREAIYESLSPSRRERLHQGAAEFIEQTHPDQLSQFADVLAHHYRRTPNAAKQRVWFRAAGDAAKAAFAVDTAIGYYEDLAGLLLGDQETSETSETGELLIELGDLRYLASGWAAADRVYAQALRIAEATDDPRLRAEAHRGLGSVLSYTRTHGQALPQAVDRLRQAVVEFEQLGDLRGLAKTLERLAWMCFELGDHQGALAASERHHGIAGQLRDPVATSVALKNMAVVHWVTGDHDQALADLQEALEVATAARYRPGVVLAAHDLAGVLFERGDHIRAIRHFQHALSVALDIGDRRMVALAIGNIGEAHRRHGDYGPAVRCLAYAFRIAAEIGDRTNLAGLAGNLAVTMAAQGRTAQAEQLLTGAVGLARHLGARDFLSDSLYQQARLLASLGRLRQAEQVNREALVSASEQHHSEIELRARLLSLRLQVDLGRMDRGAAIREVRSLQDRWVEQADQAPLLDALLRLDPTQEQVRKDAIRLYQELYAQDPSVEYREAYQRLTGRALPRDQPLPSEPEVVRHEPLDLPWMLKQLERASGRGLADAARQG
jgi:tetratricopeptide (TPR) repeat protein